jgi:hypothetical protein
MARERPLERKDPMRRVDTTQFFKKDFEPAPLWVWPLTGLILGLGAAAVYVAALVFGLPGFL